MKYAEHKAPPPDLQAVLVYLRALRENYDQAIAGIEVNLDILAPKPVLLLTYEP